LISVSLLTPTSAGFHFSMHAVHLAYHTTQNSSKSKNTQ
jgi:hypothetical protein